ncbi:MAG: hypothetical protein ACWA5P_07490 [bacterium]
MSQSYSYRVHEKSDVVNGTLKKIVESKSIWLNGFPSDKGGFDITLGHRSNGIGIIGPLVKAHSFAVTTDFTGIISKLRIKEIRGSSYYTQLYMAIAIGIIIFFRSLITFISSGELLELNLHAIPLLCVIYILILELWVMTSFKRLVKKIIHYLEDEGLNIEEL